MSYGDLMRHLGYWDESARAGKVAAAAERELMIAKYKKGRWAAWMSGDLIVPHFAAETEAIQFLKNRAMRVLWRSQAIGTVSPVKKGCLPNIYVLVDHTKNIDERLAWLRNELERLEAQAEAGGADGLRKVR